MIPLFSISARKSMALVGAVATKGAVFSSTATTAPADGVAASLVSTATSRHGSAALPLSSLRQGCRAHSTNAFAPTAVRLEDESAAAAAGAAVKTTVTKKKVVRRRKKAASSGETEAEPHSNKEPHRETPTETEATKTPASSAVAAARAPAETTPVPQKSKTAMVKSYRVEDVSALCGQHDAIFARRLTTGGCQFFAWPGTPLDVAGRAIVSMPDSIRTVHSVFGRKETPLDLVMDVDCPVPPENWTMNKITPFQQKLLDDTLTVVHAEISRIGEEVATAVVLQSPNLKKASFHIHIKLKDAAFHDFDSVHGFLAQFKDKIPYVDLQIYRPHGMLRMFSCMKENHTSAMVVFETEKWNIGFPGGKVPEAAAALHSICVREPGTFKRLLTFKPPNPIRTAHPGASATGEGSGEGGQRYHVVEMPRTAEEAVSNASRWLRHASDAEVGEWRSWIGLGICAFRVAYHFKDTPSLKRSPLEELQEAWVRGSQNCPTKFKPGDCETRWANFDPNKLNSGDWWMAYQRLGRTAFAVQEGKAREEQRAKERLERIESRRHAPKPTAPSTGSVPSSSSTTTTSSAPSTSPADATRSSSAEPTASRSPSAKEGGAAVEEKKLLRKRVKKTK